MDTFALWLVDIDGVDDSGSRVEIVTASGKGPAAVPGAFISLVLDSEQVFPTVRGQPFSIGILQLVLYFLAGKAQHKKLVLVRIDFE